MSLVVAALLAGAGAGVSGAASAAVTDAYAGLRDLVRRRLGSRQPGAELVVDREHADSEAWEAELVPALTDAQIGRDRQVIAAAQHLLALVDPPGATAGKYAVDLREAKGVQVGDHNVQYNQFS